MHVLRADQATIIVGQGQPTHRNERPNDAGLTVGRRAQTKLDSSAALLDSAS